jgi:HD superfamily phosphohydrolase
VGLAGTTYPAARHTRFEHSLGTAAVASRMAQQLAADCRQRADAAHAVGEEEIRLVRLAALLLDVGHCPYSHLSEAVYGSMPEFAEARAIVKEQTGQDVSPSPHEILSYLIIVSDAFVSFFFRKIKYPGVKTKQQAKELLQKAANMVVGAVNYGKDGSKHSFLTAILNGDFDADKLDYTQRDSYTAGIALTYGVERFLLKLVLCKVDEDGVADYRLAVTSDALSTVEELLFNRSMLYHYMYRHQKVLAAEAQMRDAIYALVRVGKISHPCDFLSLNDQELNALYHSQKRPFAADGAEGKTLASMKQAFSHRTLLKRAAELSPDGFSQEDKNLLTSKPSISAFLLI